MIRLRLSEQNTEPGNLPRGWRRVGLPPSGGRRGSDWRRSRPACRRLRPIRRRRGRTSPAHSGGRRCEREASCLYSETDAQNLVSTILLPVLLVLLLQYYHHHHLYRSLVGGDSPVQVVVISSFPARVTGWDQQAVSQITPTNQIQLLLS